jgi:hypothetical protein
MNPLRWRKMTWLILVFSGLMLAWAIAGTTTEVCADYPAGSADREACELGEDIGTGIAATLIFTLWFVGFVVLSIIWFMTRPRHRQCPRCGEDVKTGRTACGKCGYDFATALSTVSERSFTS